MTPAGSLPAGVIFDNDGVLVDSEPIIDRVLAEMITAAGASVSAADVDTHLHGMSLAYTREWVKARHGVALPSNFENELSHRLAVSLATELKAVPGIRLVLVELSRSSTAIAVASNSRRSQVLQSHRVTGLRPLLDPTIVVAVDDVAMGKPAPDVYLAAAQRISVATQDCVVIEDSAPGIEAAHMAGMVAIGFAARTNPSKLHQADAIVETAADLITELGRWGPGLGA